MKSFFSFVAFVVFTILTIKAFQMSEPEMGFVFAGFALIGAAVWHGPLNSSGGRRKSSARRRKGRSAALPSFMASSDD